MSEQSSTPKVVEISCRATENCPGRQAEIVHVHNHEDIAGLETTSRTIRYRCLTCNKSFTVTL